ncbi:MAG: RdgB/HAM1 family non-canonical purine NTP pyrophosphatase [Crocinitomicaceae bacterium]|nr:RdgB/HAM1 family non-canonical purine NTP pyrophosphatase [Crocinitomicaceae bacterium]
MKKLVFASANKNKIKEIKALLPAHFELITLEEIGFHEEIPETADTISGNAIQKTTFLKDKLALDCFSDDTGLIIPALNGEPGVYSARYAGPQRNADDNMNLVLEKLANQSDRSAFFMTTIALWYENELHLFEGKVTGEIINEKRGDEGFGYDPIFIPENQGKTFAEMSMDEKSKFSHRARAFEKMMAFLSEKAS